MAAIVDNWDKLSYFQKMAAIRGLKGWSYKEAASLIGVNEHTYKKIENGGYEKLKMKWINSIITVFEMERAELPQPNDTRIQVIRLWCEGYSDSEIVEIIGKTRQWVHQVRKEHNLFMNKLDPVEREEESA